MMVYSKLSPAVGRAETGRMENWRGRIRIRIKIRLFFWFLAFGLFVGYHSVPFLFSALGRYFSWF
jgi:hypothetical protein